MASARAPPKRSFDGSGLGQHNRGISDADLEGMVMGKKCNQVKTMIRNIIDSGDMKVGQFTDAIGVSGNSYRTFMGQNGPTKGGSSETYYNAWAFFKEREMRGVPPPKKHKAASARTSAAPGKNGGNGNKGAKPDISYVVLPGEDAESVPIYDTCDEIRKTINEHLRKDNVTAAAFCRDLYAQYHTSKAPSRIQSGQLSTFRSKKGPKTGNTSSVFYAVYVFFEKIRIKERKPKSKLWEEMEEAWPQGMDTDRDTGM